MRASTSSKSKRCERLNLVKYNYVLNYLKIYAVGYVAIVDMRHWSMITKSISQSNLPCSITHTPISYTFPQSSPKFPIFPTCKGRVKVTLPPKCIARWVCLLSTEPSSLIMPVLLKSFSTCWCWRTYSASLRSDGLEGLFWMRLSCLCWTISK